MSHAFVVLAYGASPFLGACLRSLQAQTRPSPIVVTTSTPSDAIATAAREAGAELRLNPERRGIAGDWNFALKASDARYVTLAHQDDVYAPGFAERTLALFARHPEGSLCFTSQREIDDAGVARASRVSRVQRLIEAVTLGRREVARGLPMRLFLSFGNPLPCSSVTFDRTRLADFAFREGFASNLDWEAWWSLLQQGHVFLHAPEPLVARRRNALTETSRQIAAGGRAREDRAMFSRIWPAPIDRALAALYASSYR
jgi:cellulose synthase/poly-beta-1,6-N-acetylglucosamine synthase-like glycosyltransferase